MGDQHPLAVELIAATTYEPGSENTHEHIAGCAACRAEFERLAADVDVADTAPDDAALRRILEGAAALPNALMETIRSAGQVEPVHGELWRIGTADEALLVWVSTVKGDSARIVPMTLDLDLADDSSVYVNAGASPLGVDGILLRDLACVVPLSVFLSRVGPVHLPDDDASSERLLGAAAIGETFAFPIQNPHDARIEPRLEIEELLEHLARSGSTLQTVANWDYAYTFEALRIDLRERIFGSDLHSLPRQIFPIAQSNTLTCLAKVTHLQRSTVIAALGGNRPHAVFNAEALAGACREVLRLEPDASAVAVIIPVDTWVTALFTSADTNPALIAPTGSPVGPTTTYIGYGLVDTMHKYLDGRVSAWEEAEIAPTRLNTSDIDDVVQRHAAAAVQGVRKTGSRARAPKNEVWTNLPVSTNEAVARFVHALLNNSSVTDALEDLQGPRLEDDR